MKFSYEDLKLLVIALAEHRGTFNNGAKLMVKVWVGLVWGMGVGLVWEDGGGACSHTSHCVHKFQGGVRFWGGGKLD